ncbi:sensor histidine kinase [Nocardia sp. NPDC050406]|uniref:sensor histidine kinase n=1 Tax=Nocardia sp. NPDC050406 TaxID=3364318 RepID=UPI00379333D3
MGTDRIWLKDWGIAVALAAIQLISGLSEHHSPTPVVLVGYALLIAGGLALGLRRHAPVAVLAATGVCALGYQAIGFEVPLLAFLFAVYAVVRAGHRLIVVAGAVFMLAALPLAILAAPHDWSVSQSLTQSRDLLPIAWVIAAGAAGEALRQAERRADEAERTREETARRRADEERLHIARELHDSLTHQISVIKVQADVAVHLARKRGEPVSEALLAIQEAGQEASRELRATLEALRDDDKNPPHGLDHIPELVERARTPGLEVQLTVEGRRPDVPTAVDRTAYRIVQESLTNIARHAAAATASVLIEYRPDTLVIRVDDDGRATTDAAPPPGVGLLGMRERVTALGGRLRAAPRETGGFRVHAEIPVAP